MEMAFPRALSVVVFSVCCLVLPVHGIYSSPVSDPEPEITYEVHFQDSPPDAVCEGGSVSVTITNFNETAANVTVVALNGTAIGGVDFDDEPKNYTIPGMQNVTHEVEILRDGDFELSEETFELQLFGNDGTEIANTSTIEITIAPDYQCENTRVPIIRKFFGGFRGRVVFTSEYDVSDWEVKLMFTRRVKKLELLDCDVEIGDVTRHPSLRTFYTLVPTAKTQTLRKGDKLPIEFIAKTNNRLRGMSARALFIPLTFL